MDAVGASLCEKSSEWMGTFCVFRRSNKAFPAKSTISAAASTAVVTQTDKRIFCLVVIVFCSSLSIRIRAALSLPGRSYPIFPPHLPFCFLQSVPTVYKDQYACQRRKPTLAASSSLMDASPATKVTQSVSEDALKKPCCSLYTEGMPIVSLV